MVQGFQDLLIDGPCSDDVLHDDGPGLLPLAVEPGDCLLIKLQRPGKAEPDQVVSSLLQVKSMAGRSRMDQADLEVPVIPAADVFIRGELCVFYPQGVQPFLDPCQVMLIPVSCLDRFSSCRFNNVLKGIQLPVVDHHILTAV